MEVLAIRTEETQSQDLEKHLLMGGKGAHQLHLTLAVVLVRMLLEDLEAAVELVMLLLELVEVTAEAAVPMDVRQEAAVVAVLLTMEQIKIMQVE